MKEMKEDFEELVLSLYKVPMTGLFGDEVADYIWKTMESSFLHSKVHYKNDYIAGYMMAVIDTMSPKNEKFESMLEVRNKSKEN